MPSRDLSVQLLNAIRRCRVRSMLMPCQSYDDSTCESALTRCGTGAHPSVSPVDQSAGELHRKLPAAERLPLPSEERDQPLSAVGSWDEDAPLHLTFRALVGHAPSGRGVLPADGKVVHGEVAEKVGAGQVVKHQSQSLRVRLVAQQHSVQVPDPPSLTELIALPAGGHSEEGEQEEGRITLKFYRVINLFRIIKSNPQTNEMW